MKTVIIGLDAYDPKIFERLSEQGLLPNLTRYVGSGGYSRFEVSNPPQSEVSWTSIATGMNPGHHGIFDFVHRHPKTYAPYVSLLVMKKGVGGSRFVPPHSTKTLFNHAAMQGYPAVSLWWPATFPARPDIAVRTLPGLGTPDVQGNFGVGTLFTEDIGDVEFQQKVPVSRLISGQKGLYKGAVRGVSGERRGKVVDVTTDFQLEINGESQATLNVSGKRYALELGAWSPIVSVDFKVRPLIRIRAVTRFILTQVVPHIKLYCLPIQIHPESPIWRYANPASYGKKIWRSVSPFLTLGMPQDTVGLEDGCIDDQQFLALCQSILDTREAILIHELKNFKEGVLASVFDSLDRIQHIFYSVRPDIVDQWYVKLDALVGRVQKAISELPGNPTRLVIVSDHGISTYKHKVNLNRWLMDNGYLFARGTPGQGDLSDVEWSRSLAYAVGLNSLYVNLAGREGKGSVSMEQYGQLLGQLQNDLQAFKGPEGKVINQAWTNEEAFNGPFTTNAPDLVIGYAPGYRASAETGLGQWGQDQIVSNGDHWSADHCIDYRCVPGVIFSNQDLGDWHDPSYRDFPEIALGETMEGASGKAVMPDDEDDETLKERLKGLGYL